MKIILLAGLLFCSTLAYANVSGTYYECFRNDSLGSGNDPAFASAFIPYSSSGAQVVFNDNEVYHDVRVSRTNETSPSNYDLNLTSSSGDLIGVIEQRGEGTGFQIHSLHLWCRVVVLNIQF